MEYFWNTSFEVPDKAVLLDKLEKGIGQFYLSEEQPEQLDEIYVPVTLTVDKYLVQNLICLEEIIAVVISSAYSTKVKYVNSTVKENSYVFIPYTENGDRIWIDSDNIVTFPIKEWTDKKLISTHPLTRFVIEKLNKTGITYYNIKNTTLALINLNDNIDLGPDIDLLDDFSVEVERHLQTLTKEGYFSYSFSWHDLNSYEIVKEICFLWDIDIISDMDPSNWVLRANVDFGQLSENWLRQAVDSASHGYFPIFNFKIDFEFSEEYSRHYGWDYKDVILKYAAYLSLSQLITTQEYFRPQIGQDSPVINSDLSLSVRLPSYKISQIFKDYLIMNLNQGISNGGLKPLQGVWNIQPIDQITDAVIQRWKIQQEDNESYPMILSNLAGNNILIDRSQKRNYDNNTIIYGVNENEKEPESLLTALRNFYIKCHDDIDAVSLEKISEMNLEQLLEIVPIKEGNKTYCFSSETLKRLEKPENPLTRQPLPKIVDVEQRFRGVYDLGPLWGVLPETEKKNLNLTGNILVQRQPVPAERRELVGNIFQVSAIFPDGRQVLLFDISLPLIELDRISKLREALKILWPTGFFLNDWNTAVWTTGDFESIEVKPLNRFLLQASDNIYDGNIAYQYILKASEEI